MCATRPGPACPQDADFIGDRPSLTEDCLYLNVTTPRRVTANLPVMVWIHGGGFLGGSGAIYDFGLAVERVRAAVEVTRGPPVPLVCTRPACAPSTGCARSSRPSAGRSTW